MTWLLLGKHKTHCKNSTIMKHKNPIFLFLIFTTSSLSPPDDLECPVLPAFCDLSFNIKKAKFSGDPAAQINGKPEFSNPRGEIATTKFPERKFQNLNQLVNGKKVRGVLFNIISEISALQNGLHLSQHVIGGAHRQAG